MKTYYVIRSGWNAANQSALYSERNPSNQFESRQLALVGIVEAESEEAAITMADCTCYKNQRLFAETNPRAIKGLTEEIRKYSNIG